VPTLVFNISAYKIFIMKLLKFIFISPALVFVFNSCSKNFTNLTPNSSIYADSAMTSVANVREAVIGLYAGLANSSYYGEAAVLIPDLTADNIYRSVQTGARYSAWAQATVTPTDSYAQGLWDQIYSIVINANTVINKAPLLHPSSTAGVAGTDSIELRQLIGEAYALRALAFFDATRFFCYSYTKAVNSDSAGIDLGIPIVLQSYASNLNQIIGSTPGSSKYYVARSTVEQSYAQVLNDIDSALVYLPQNTNGTVLNNGMYDPTLFRIRMNYWSVNALAARVCLYKGDYPNAIKYANTVINNPQYQLLPALTLTTDFHAQHNYESIFEIENNQSNNQGASGIAYEFNQQGYGEMLAPDTMGKIYDSLDVRGPYQGTAGFFYPGNRNAFGGETNTYIINKYNNIYNFNENIKIFRLSEMYLIRAEAEGYSISYGAGYTDLLKIANARNEIIRQTPPLTRSSFDTAILLENRKEFAFEGHRIFDLTRIKNSNHTSQGYTYSYYHFFVQKVKSGQLARSGSLTSTQKKYALMPVPSADIKDYASDSLTLLQNLDY
jgi:hypothetical protein